MPDTFAVADAVSPYDELMAYEYLYSREGTSRGKMSRILSEHGTRPTFALEAYSGFLDPSGYDDVRDYVSARLGSFSVLVDGTPQFPTKLRAQKYPLPVFYYRGDISLVEYPCVSVVGTRHPSERGAASARKIAGALAEQDIIIVAGLAEGIDTCAMTEAMAHGKRVIGVIGTPIDHYYPAKNRELQDQVAQDGLLISQVPIYQYDHQPFSTKHYYFPERNMTMAALSKATVIVEAGETSGTRTQARACIDQGKTLIFLSEMLQSVSWAQDFVDKGAIVARSISDIMKAIGRK